MYSYRCIHYHFTIITTALHNLYYIIVTSLQMALMSILLLEEAECVSSEKQRQREMEARADDQPVAMDTETAEPATTVR